MVNTKPSGSRTQRRQRGSPELGVDGAWPAPADEVVNVVVVVASAADRRCFLAFFNRENEPEEPKKQRNILLLVCLDS